MHFFVSEHGWCHQVHVAQYCIPVHMQLVLVPKSPLEYASGFLTKSSKDFHEDTRLVSIYCFGKPHDMVHVASVIIPIGEEVSSKLRFHAICPGVALSFYTTNLRVAANRQTESRLVSVLGCTRFFLLGRAFSE